MKYNGNTGEYFEIQEINYKNCEHLKETQKDTLRFLWFRSDGNELRIDGKLYTFNTNDIVCLTQFHELEYGSINKVNLLRFNRPFYCILDHDSEVGCKGVLYYGAAQLPIVKADSKDVEVLSTAWRMATLELDMQDSLQLEMLQMMLKRILILTTRIYKKQFPKRVISEHQHDMIREFNYLVESHFKTEHSVSSYAEKLFKSPKTLSNTFKKLGQKSPIQFIHDRLLLEARRLLYYSDADISEIAYELGFADVQTFSRFFKKLEGMSPSAYRNSDQKVPSD